MALTSFLNVNGYDFPCPRDGFNYIISTTVNAGRNTNNAVIGQRIGRDLYKLGPLEWVGLEPKEWQMIKRVKQTSGGKVMIECGYMENGECNTCAECMSCPENNLKEEKEHEN